MHGLLQGDANVAWPHAHVHPKQVVERYEGQWNAGKMHGFGKYLYADGGLYEGVNVCSAGDQDVGLYVCVCVRRMYACVRAQIHRWIDLSICMYSGPMCMFCVHACMHARPDSPSRRMGGRQNARAGVLCLCQQESVRGRVGRGRQGGLFA